MNMRVPEAPYLVDQQHFIDPALQSHDLLQITQPIMPADVALKPIDLAAIKSRVLDTYIVPSGAYADVVVFSDSQQSLLRRMTPMVSTVLEIMDHADNESIRDEESAISLQLMRMNAAAAQDRAAMVEAAKQRYELDVNDPQFEKKAAQLRRVFDMSQDAMYPTVDPALARTALDRLIGIDDSDRQPILSIETRTTWHDYLHGTFDPVFEAVYELHDPENDEEINGQHLADMTAAFMRVSGLPMTDDLDDVSKWKVRYDSSVSTFTVVPNRKEIVCGQRDRPLTRLQFEKMMMHEVVIHAWRQENGSNTGFPAMQTGLPGYLETEEGIGLLIESLWSGEDPDTVGRDHYRYVAVAYADGAFDSIKHSEQETFDLMVCLMDANGIVDDTNELHNHVMRIYRGMPADWRMHSNLSYLSGKIKAMELFEQQFAAGIPLEEQFELLRIGKNNPCNPQQAELARRIARLRTPE